MANEKMILLQLAGVVAGHMEQQRRMQVRQLEILGKIAECGIGVAVDVHGGGSTAGELRQVQEIVAEGLADSSEHQELIEWLNLSLVGLINEAHFEEDDRGDHN